MSALVNLTNALIDDSVRELDGKVLTRPALLFSDGVSTTYAADVAIDGQDEPLRNVTIATGNRELTYADAGSAVRLRRSASGQFEIVGFSKRGPGDFIRIGINLETGALGVAQNVGLYSRPLTLGELGDYLGGFGTVPLGATALYRGDDFLELRV